ncbi:HpcH/HpaI aldolase/citrate lyase family protein [Microvirga subterranea]|uniref:Citrate lyase subunit beta/citryl-CoA lyase n=1 Tax=Microvirga subterranea TaxID=186651 RepID=A0A370HUZ0_9HYPH|nr:CoA ester lyase [Microvirga subterranea]RDI62336.1 citrate lyase subunit beta/citryl-CoA lyase [Microvirga subterranea]
MTPIRPRRSALYMPASNARALEKARTLPADAVIFDLEDAVAPDRKELARDQACAAVRNGGYGAREVVIRINALDTPWGEADLAAVAQAAPDAVLVPKVSSAETLAAVGMRLRRHGAPERTRVWAMIETPLAVLKAEEIASSALDVDSRLACFVLGTNDLAKETRARLLPTRAAMMPWLMQVLAAARAYGVDVLDGVYNDLSDEAGFRAECEQGRDCGFDGKSLIHPNQIAVANEVFGPTPGEVAAARAIVEVFERPENADKGAVAVDGRMVERLHAEMAKRMLDLAEAIEKLGRG